MDQIDTSKKDIDDSIENIPLNVPLTNIKLPNQWVFYLYDKQLYKKMANRPNFQAKPHKELCTISTVNDLIYILQLMEVKIEPKLKSDFINTNKINLDANDYIIMRKGIEPIWEDPKNSDGGTFTIKMNHTKGYDVWSTFVMYMLGETMTYEMHNINGITVSYISDAYNFNGQPSTNTNSYTYIKIWDGKSNRDPNPSRNPDPSYFEKILPLNLLNKIKSESLMYSVNNKKMRFGDKNVIKNFGGSTNNRGKSHRGGFSNFNHKR